MRFLDETRRRSRPNVLLIGIDTLRADRLGSYGYARPTSPHIDALAAESVLFEQAISQSPWTLPAFASIFTGVLPSTHGAGRGKGWSVDHLDPRRPTLATLLRAEGYRTASFVTNGWVSADVGMAAGIDREDTFLWIHSSGTQAAAITWLRAHGHEQFYMFFHVVDPHGPYDAPPEYLAALDVRADVESRDRVNDVASTLRPRSDLRPGDRAILSALYDAEVRQADARVGAVLAELRALDLLERTVVVVVSDHGEEILDHGGLGHGHSLYDELLHVPLLVRLPGGRRVGRIADQVRTMDLLPTLLELCDVPVPAGLDGRSLLPLLRNDRRRAALPGAPSEFLWSGDERKSLRQSGGKIVLEPATGDLVWYDLRRDPHEVRQRRGVSERGAALRDDLERVFATRLDGLLLTAFGDASDHDLRLVLETGSRFEEAVLEGGERRDRLRMSPDRRRLKACLHLKGSGVHFRVDVDALRVRTADDAPVRLGGTLDRSPLARSAIRRGQARRSPRGPQPWTFASDDPRIVVPVGYRPVRARHVTLAVTARRARTAPRGPLSAQTQRSLRALGYLGEDDDPGGGG